MAFHSKENSISRGARTNRRDKESILGLSGWLFADLLLAIAVIFLVVQDRAQPADAGSESTTTTTSTSIPGQLGLIADPERQLFVTVPDGALPASANEFKDRLARSQIVLGETKKLSYTWKKLKDENYLVGMIIWFARNSALSEKTSNNHLSHFVQFLIDKNLIDEKRQLGNKVYKEFPNISKYYESRIGNSLKFRIFLMQPEG